MQLLRRFKALALLFAMAMFATASIEQLGWWNFDRRRRREDFGITLPAEPGALSRRFFGVDGLLLGVAGGADFDEAKAKLTTERLAIITEATGLYDKANAEGRPLTDDERTRGDAIEARRTEIDASLVQLEADAKRAAELIADRQRMVAEATSATGKPPAVITKRGEPEMVKAEGLPTPFRNLGEQLAAVAMAAKFPHMEPDKRLMDIQAAASGASEGVSSDGGFLVQPDFSNELLNLTHETGKLLPLCDRTTVGANSNGLKLNVIDETSRVNGSRFGGVLGYWTAEAAALTGTKPKFRQMELTLQKLTGLYYATDELLQDASALGQVASRAFAEEFGFKIDDAIIRGTGAGMPLGILGHAGTVSIAKETGQDAATIVKQNIEKMYARMPANKIGNATWFINQDCWTALFELSVAVGVGGVPLFIPSNSLANAPFGTLLGRPIMPIEQCETLGTVGDIIFAAFDDYKVIDKGGVESASSIHVQFLTDETVFRFILRLDGQPKYNAPVTPFKGSATQAPFLTLATRA